MAKDIWDQAADLDIWDQAADVEAPPSMLPGNPGSGPAGRFVSGLVGAVNPVPALREAGRVGANETLKNVVRGQGAQFQKAGQALKNEGEFKGWSLPNRLSSALGYGVAGALPLVGPAAAQAGEQIGAGNVAGGLGAGVGLTLPSMLGGVAARVAGRGLEGTAGHLAESALGVRAIDRSYNKTPGSAILRETSGIRPGTVSESARGRVNELVNELESGARGSSRLVDTQPVIDYLDRERGTAQRQNAQGVYADLGPMKEHFETNSMTGQKIPTQLDPREAIDLKRGFSKEYVTSWNPQAVRRSGVNQTARKAYGTLDKAIDAAYPEGADLNQRISSLIPVEQRAAAVDSGASIGQRVMHRVGAHTGAAALGIAGGYEFGPLGAVAGLVVPEMLASPTAQMLAARGLYGAGRILGSKPTQFAIRNSPYVASLPKLPGDYSNFRTLPEPIR